jgi:4-hydroxy-tetrahydrodipicolinate reductase
MQPVPVLLYGLGPIGCRIAAAAVREPRLKIVGAVDVRTDLVDRSLAELVEGAPDVPIRARVAEFLSSAPERHTTVLHATSSWLVRVADQLRELLDAGLHVVSTCEELSWPFDRHPELSRELDERAGRAARTVVATGINPGFLMDQLPVVLTGATHDVRSVEVLRRQNPGKRRRSFQEKVGMDLSWADYQARAAGGGFGHVGLAESGRLVAAGLGWTIDNWADVLEPVRPDPVGGVLGTRQILTGATADGRTLALRFEAHSGVTEDVDEIAIGGTPPLRARFIGGVHGDDGTAAAVLRAARVIPSAPRGLVTVLDLPLRAR